MGGFRKAMPFTFGCMVIGGLALAGIPPFSGFFSKDEILSTSVERGGWHVVLDVARLRRRVPDRDLHVPDDLPRVLRRAGRRRRASSSTGHLHHAPEPRNPATGEVEDTDVGFPGPEHHIAERERPMKVAMGVLAVLARIGGVLQIPQRHRRAARAFLEPTFADSQLYEELEPSSEALGIGAGGRRRCSACSASPSPSDLWVKRPEPPAAIQRALLGGLHRFFVNKWYFDEADRPR